MTTYVPPERALALADGRPPLDGAQSGRPAVIPPQPPDFTRFIGPDGYSDDWVPPGVPEDRSSYLGYLPGIYHDNEFLARFLLIFEHILGPIDRTVANLHHYFSPDTVPSEAVNWLASWLGLVMDERMPEDSRREIIRSAAELYRWRGTRRGLARYLTLYTGIEPEIVEPTLSEVAASRNRGFRFTVRMSIPADSPVTRSMLEAIVESEKPAFAGCTLELV
jgi:phage tail-like protein